MNNNFNSTDTVKTSNDNLKSNSSKAYNIQRIRHRLALAKKATMISSSSTAKRSPVVAATLKKSVLGRPPQVQVTPRVNAIPATHQGTSSYPGDELDPPDEDDEGTEEGRTIGMKSRRSSGSIVRKDRANHPHASAAIHANGESKLQPATRLPEVVARHVAGLLGDAYVDVLTDEEVTDLLSHNFVFVYGGLSVMLYRMEQSGKLPLQEVDDSRMRDCAKDIAAANRPKTVRQIVENCLLSDVQDLAKKRYFIDAVNVKRKKDAHGKETNELDFYFATPETSAENKPVPCVSAVVGPSGAGKTTFCIKAVSARLRTTIDGGSSTSKQIMFTHHTTFRAVDEPSVATVYNAVRDLCIENEIDAPPDSNTFLKDVFLHVIVDECERFDSMSEDAFKTWRNARIAHFLEGFAGVHITLAGTMLDVRIAAVGSESPGFQKIRLLPWTMQNFKVFLAGTLVHVHDNVTSFVEKSALLKQLTTNARAAVFMVAAKQMRLLADTVQASHAAILDEVVFNYLKYNRLSRYTSNEKACVGLSALRCALGLHINADNPNAPSAVEEHCIRCGLVTWNIELLRGDGAEIPDRYICVDGKARILMQPAVVLVCLVMCNLLPSCQQFEGWSGAEAIAALWAACSIPYVAKLTGANPPSDARLVAPHNKMPYVHTSAHKFGCSRSKDSPLLFADIPLDDVPIAAVINAERGHGMDVVAPWLVVQAKHNVTRNSPCNVNVMEELGKAGLFAGSPLTPLTKALMVAWKNVPISTPPAVLTPLSDLLEHVPKNRWDKSIGVAKNALKERNLGSSSNTSTSKNTPVVTHETVDSVPKGSVRVVLLLFGHSFLLKTSGSAKDGTSSISSPQLLVTGAGGCVRLLTVAKKKALANASAMPAESEAAQNALRTLAAAVEAANPDVDFVLDVVYQPL